MREIGATKATSRTGAVGRRGELLAQAFLERAGYRIVDVNVRWAGHCADGLPGELDIIAWDGAALCFVEVKTRRVRDARLANGGDVAPALAVNADKQRRIARLAVAYAGKHGLYHGGDDEANLVPLRFDVVSVVLVGVGSDDAPDAGRALPPRLIKGAFLAPDGWED